MAGLEPLLPLIYHEKQQPGSMLCAQHALNSLLQGNYFTAPDLSEIAQNLDDLEGSYNTEDPSDTSNNMDDSGFFSVQVLENALEVWGLSLLRWRGEQMRPYQDHPEEERAFIFNQQQHWYTLRRFGSSELLEDGTGAGHWFNLNSSISNPEWVSKLYLHMFIQQAEADGYSVFVVRPTDPEAPLTLPKTEADDVAATLPDPTDTRRTGQNDILDFEGIEDEDMELQMALQASLAPPDLSSPPPTNPPELFRAPIPLPSVDSYPPSGSRTPSQPTTTTTTSNLLPPLDADDDDAHDHDSVEASMAQSRRIYERMLAEQAQAHRELEEEGGGVNARRRQQEEEEEEMLRRAIAESEEMARIEGHGKPDDPDEMDVDRSHPPSAALTGSGFTSAEHRNYDDEDAELQAALRASLESIPGGHIPIAPDVAPPIPRPSASVPHAPIAEDDDESITSSEDTAAMEESSSVSDAPEGPAESVDVEEMRRRRLARFGG